MTALVLNGRISVSQRISIGLVSLFLGTLLVFGTGFAGDQRMHNAAHDTRHAIGFPCH
jgi:cobalt transporter subunit CbtB